MSTKQIAALLYALVVPVVASAQTATGPAGAPPELVIAVAVNDQTLEIRRFVERMVTRTTTIPLPPGVKVQAKNGSVGPTTTTEVVSVVETHTTRFDIRNIAAQCIDGRTVSGKALIAALAKPTAIILAKPGQPVDPLFSKLFKPETLVLQLPAPQPTHPVFVYLRTALSNPLVSIGFATAYAGRGDISASRQHSPRRLCLRSLRRAVVPGSPRRRRGRAGSGPLGWLTTSTCRPCRRCGLAPCSPELWR